jgi:hypothetical protein
MKAEVEDEISKVMSDFEVKMVLYDLT